MGGAASLPSGQPGGERQGVKKRIVSNDQGTAPQVAP